MCVSVEGVVGPCAHCVSLSSAQRDVESLRHHAASDYNLLFESTNAEIVALKRDKEAREKREKETVAARQAQSKATSVQSEERERERERETQDAPMCAAVHRGQQLTCRCLRILFLCCQYCRQRACSLPPAVEASLSQREV